MDADKIKELSWPSELHRQETKLPINVTANHKVQPQIILPRIYLHTKVCQFPERSVHARSRTSSHTKVVVLGQS